MTSDPILEAILIYRKGWEAFCAAPDEESEELVHLWHDPHTVLVNWSQGCRSREGAIAALEIAVYEDDTGDSPVTGPMLRAALAYFKGEQGQAPLSDYPGGAQ